MNADGYYADDEQGWPKEVLPNNDPTIKEVVNKYVSLECGFWHLTTERKIDD